MQELDLTWKRLFAVWWLVLWRGLVGAFLLGVVLGALNGLAGIILRWPPERTHLITTILGVLAGLAVGIIALRMALRKRYGDFRLAIVPRNEDEDGLGALAKGDAQDRQEPKF
jgi:hypothetical protein